MDVLLKKRLANISIGIGILTIDTFLLIVRYDLFSISLPAVLYKTILGANPLLFAFLFIMAVYEIVRKPKTNKQQKGLADPSRRKFLTFTATLAHDESIQAFNKKVVAGVATFTGKRKAQTSIPIIPAGADFYDKYKTECNSCMACVQACPQHILEPGLKIEQGMQPKLVFQKGWCVPDCTKCNEVCPTTALKLITKEEKKNIHIGHAVWIKENCIAAEGKECRICEEVCPNKCIEIVQNGRKAYPVISNNNCQGCGACEYACPSSPLKGIYVEGYAEHVCTESDEIEEDLY